MEIVPGEMIPLGSKERESRLNFLPIFYTGEFVKSIPNFDRLIPNFITKKQQSVSLKRQIYTTERT